MAYSKICVTINYYKEFKRQENADMWTCGQDTMNGNFVEESCNPTDSSDEKWRRLRGKE